MSSRASRPLPPERLATIDGWGLNIASRDDAIRRLVKDSRAGAGYILACMNLDHLVKLRTTPAFRAVYEHPATYVMADGAPVAVLARRQNASVERSPGPDLMLPLCKAAAGAGLPVFMFGTRRDVLDAGAKRLLAACPGLDIRGTEAPPFGYDPQSAEADAAADRIAATGARIVLLGLGSPKQELFAVRALARHPHLGFICIGAALDFLTGEQLRAPSAMRRAGLEWAWRLATSPRRLGVRYLRCAALLAEIAILEPLRRRRGPAPSGSRPA